MAVGVGLFLGFKRCCSDGLNAAQDAVAAADAV